MSVQILRWILTTKITTRWAEIICMMSFYSFIVSPCQPPPTPSPPSSTDTCQPVNPSPPLIQPGAANSTAWRQIELYSDKIQMKKVPLDRNSNPVPSPLPSFPPPLLHPCSLPSPSLFLISSQPFHPLPPLPNHPVLLPVSFTRLISTSLRPETNYSPLPLPYYCTPPLKQKLPVVPEVM